MPFTYRFLGVLLLVSAFLLFLVQPMISKILLPVLGGTPAVWTTSMLFFQVLLLAGYCWAHLMIRYMPLYGPPFLQILLTVVAFFVISPHEFSSPDLASNESPVLWQLKTMFFMIGLPYFALATNAPLYQALYKKFIDQTKSQKTPYALYSLSNIGSFAALLAYPFIIEPSLNLESQTLLWRVVYGILCALIILTAVIFYKLSKDNTTNGAAPKVQDKQRFFDHYSFKDIGLWLVLAFIPSSLMLGVTSHVTTDVASIPLLWIIPLAFYLGSFIIAFAEPPLWWAQKDDFAYFLALLSVIVIFATSIFPLPEYGVALVIVHYIGFLFIATYTHLLLAKAKPDPEHLTIFFIVMSVGGACGGLFNGLLAYHIFNTPTEYTLVMSIFTVGAICYKKTGWMTLPKSGLITTIVIVFMLIMAYLGLIYSAMTVIAILAMVLVSALFIKEKNVIMAISLFFILFCLGKELYHTDIYQSRNVFGTLRIADNEKDSTRSLTHGTTKHGLQSLPLSDNPKPTAYYHPEGPYGDIMQLVSALPVQTQNFAILGMGTGASGCYTKQGREFDFFEIDRQVVEVATNPNYFTFVSSCQPDADIIMGDARKRLEDQPDNSYDVILLDVFSSDAIPVHFLTREAVSLYKSKIKDNGFIVFHISNRYFDLSSVIANLAEDADLHYAYKLGKSSDEVDDIEYLPTSYMIMSPSKEMVNILTSYNVDWETENLAAPNDRLWTDSYVNIFQALRF